MDIEMRDFFHSLFFSFNASELALWDAMDGDKR